MSKTHAAVSTRPEAANGLHTTAATATTPTVYHRFPQGFRWGVAAAAYQIEGAANEDGRGSSIWDDFCAKPGAVRNGDSGAVACDHYHRYAEDLDLMASLGVRNYRFSFAWPRILPEGRGRLNQAGLDFYDRLVDGMLARGIEPSATCYHWDLPSALEREGGWRVRQTAEAFGEFAGVLSQRYSDRVRFWSTLNEPWCSWWLGHHTGTHAPGAKEPAKVLRDVAHHLLLAHGLGVQAIRAAARGPVQVGIVHNSNNLMPFTESKEDVAATSELWLERNGWLLMPVFRGCYPEREWRDLGADVPTVHHGDLGIISQPLDYLGLNVYFAEEIVRAGHPPALLEKYFPRTDFNWPITPEAPYWSARFAHEHFGPIDLYMTENGCCYPDQVNARGEVDDFARLHFIKENLRCLHRATAEGIPLKGYYLWSILDNFEWAEGYAKRFGIVHVNFTTQQRTPKASAHWYSHVMAQNGF